MLKFVALAVVLVAVFAIEGVDVSQVCNNFSCLKADGIDFMMARCWTSYGAYDSAGMTNVRNAQNAGITYRDLYMFPCRGKSAKSQVDELLGNLSAEEAEIQGEERELLESSYGMIWLDIESNPSSGCGWGSDYSSNCQYVQDLVSAVKGHGKKVGIYSSYYQWEGIMGSASACTEVASVDLWYAHYDDHETFSDFSSFGGWSRPAIKQYKGDVTECGCGVDKNFY